MADARTNGGTKLLRGIEGAHVKESYRLAAQRFGVQWNGRRYDRLSPQAADIPNQAINHAASAVEGAAAIAVSATATIPQLGFIHEDSGQSFVLDIADLAREQATLPIAFGAAKESMKTGEGIDRLVRRRAGRLFREIGLIPLLIDRIKALLEPDKTKTTAPLSSASVDARNTNERLDESGET